MIPRITKNLLNLVIFTAFLVVLFILISGGKTLYLYDIKIRLNSLHNPLLTLAVFLALRLSLFTDSFFSMDKAVSNISCRYNDLTGQDTRKEMWAYSLIIVVFVSFTYAGIFNNFFIQDDFCLLNESVKSSSNILNVFGRDFGDFFRPFYRFVFLLNYKLLGLKPLGYYMINYLFHIINSFLLFYFALLLTNKKSIAFLAALLFAVNFEHYQAVMKISEISSLLAAMLYLATLIFFSKYLISKKRTSYLASVTLFFFSLLTYEATVTLLPVMFLYDILFHEEFNRKAIPRLMRRYAIFLVLLIPYLVFQYYLQSKSVLVATLNEYAFSLHFFYKNFRSTVTINEWIIPVLIFFALFLRQDITVKSIKNVFNNRVLIFSFLWVPLTLVPFSLFKATTIVVSRYFYIPSIGSSIFLGLLIYSLYHIGTELIKQTDKRARERFKASLIMITVVIVLSNALTTYHKERSFIKKPDWKQIIVTLKSRYHPFPDNSTIYFLNISTTESCVRYLVHVFFSPTLEVFSSRTGKISQKNYLEEKENIFILDHVNGEIIDRTSDYIRPGEKSSSRNRPRYY